MNARFKLVPESDPIQVFPSNGEIINFGNLQLIYLTEVGGVKG